MLRNLSELFGRTVRVRNGDLGAVRDVYYDDGNWKIRYLGVSAGRLRKRNVLISPVCITTHDWKASQLTADLNGKQVEQSPRIETDQPVSRKNESEIARYFGWPMYWDAGREPPSAGAPSTGRVSTALVEEERAPGTLRSAQTTIGYAVRTFDGEIGTAEQFITDEASWVIRYIVVNTGNWPRFKRVLLYTGWLEGLDDEEHTFSTVISRTSIRNGPEYDPSVSVTRSYEARLFEYYGRSKYWRQ